MAEKPIKEVVELYPEEEREPQTFDEIVKQENILNYPTLIGATMRGGKIIAGSGDKCFKFEEDKGLWLGNATFASAPFSVDMLGVLVATNATITGAIIISSGSGIANLSDAGDLAIKDDVGASDCDTTIISGGKIITGLLTASNIITGTLDASVVTVSNLNANNIVTGVLTGRTIETASSGARIQLTNTNRMFFFNSSDVLLGVLRPNNANNSLHIASSDNDAADGSIFMFNDGEINIAPNSRLAIFSDTFPGSNDAYDLGSSSFRWQDLYLSNDIYIDNDIYPNTDNASSSLGFSTRYFLQLYAYYVRYKDIDSFQKHDDIALIKKIKAKKIKTKELAKSKRGKKVLGKEIEKEVWDERTMPKEVYQDGFYDAGAVNGLVIGTLKQIIDKVEKLEQKV